jgi:hypothetical protein
VKRLVIVLVMFAAATPAHAEDDHFQTADDQSALQSTPPPAPAPEIDDGRPRLDGLRITGELFAGSATGFVGLLVAGWTGFAINQELDPCGGSFCNVGGGIIGAEIGLVTAAPIGVYLVGSAGDQTGSFAATMLGSFAGGAAGTAIVLTGMATRQDVVIGLGAGVAIAAPLIGSVIGFNFTRRYDDGRRPKKTARIAPIVGPTSFGIAGAF